MTPKPEILVIGSPVGLVSEEAWADFTNRFHIHMYNFPTIDDFHQALQTGSYSNIAGIARIGLNLPPTCEKVLIGWTHRCLEYLPPTVKVIVNFGHGYNDEAVDKLGERGIKFSNTTGGSEATAAVGTYLIIAAFRLLSKYERMLRADQFLPALRESAKSAVDPFGKKIGIIGMGSIGQAVAKQAAALGMQINCLDRPSLRQLINDAASNHSSTGELPPITLHSDLPSLVKVVDCVLLSCPYSASTHHLVSKELLDIMKRGVRIINIARGLCVDEEALCAAIESGIVGGAALDVHHDEPKVNPRLLAYDNVTLLPHVGGLTKDSMQNHAQMAISQIISFFGDNK